MTTTPEYDYVIVGGGSAGCVLAARLSAEPQCRVALLEAGGSDDHFLLRMPLGFLRALLRPEFSWGYFSEPEPHLNGRRIWLPRGKVLGGSGSINGMFYMRGHSSDFDAWRAAGCSGWSYREVLPYFCRLESSWRGAGPYHGDSGPLPVRQIHTEKLLHEPLMQSAAGAGFNVTEDLHATLEEGFARGEVNIDRHGRRASTSRAYLHPAMGRANLSVRTDTLTTRVLIERGRAVGVECVHNGQVERVRAGREVILCGGTYNSPQLLMLSGVGPASELRRHGIPVIQDLPGVGANLCEHPHVPVEFAARAGVTFLNELRFDRLAASVLQWSLLGTGVLANQINSCNVIIRTRAQLTRPDVQLMCNPVRMDAKIWFPGFSRRQQDRITAGVVLLHEKSRGRVSLASARATDAPRILLNLFAEPEDLETAKCGIEAARRIYATRPQADLVTAETAPGATVKTDADLEAYIRASATVTQHPVGTCAMGAGAQAVLTPELCVHGVAGLRVVDASVMPSIVGANTNAAVIMIAEKASDMILGKAPLPPAEV